MQAVLLALLVFAMIPEDGAAGPAHAQLVDTQAPQDALTPAQHADIAARLQRRVVSLRRAGTIAQPTSVATAADFDLASQNVPKPFYSGTGFDWRYTLPADAPAGAWLLRAVFEGPRTSMRSRSVPM
ncbi:hypothetical protein [Dokdonella soli]|uniref:Uncharacterized protein n=1 Tax=Dokdonella soli TaxID=529810 RepID=A0ABP3U7X5_9GAMM